MSIRRLTSFVGTAALTLALTTLHAVPVHAQSFGPTPAPPPPQLPVNTAATGTVPDNTCTTNDLLGEIGNFGSGFSSSGALTYYYLAITNLLCTYSGTDSVVTAQVYATGPYTPPLLADPNAPYPWDFRGCFNSTTCSTAALWAGPDIIPTCAVALGTATIFPELSPQRAATGVACLGV